MPDELTPKQKALMDSMEKDAAERADWSVDLLQDAEGLWYITDIAMAHQSYGYDPERME